MISSEVQRTLVKSPPELWTELSDPAALARHLGEFGEIRITRVEPEQRVEWKAENATGSVMIKPSGWGTKVTLTVTKEAAEPGAQQPPEPQPAPEPRVGFFARLFGRRRREPAAPGPITSGWDSPGQPADAFAAVSRVLAPETFAGGRTTVTPWPETEPEAAPPSDAQVEAAADTPAEAPTPTGADSTP